MAGGVVVASLGFELGFDLSADVLCERTPRPETAAGWWVKWTGDVAGQDDPLTLAAADRDRHGREQGFRIGMKWISLQLGDGGELDDLT
jgi:hypothetical protein